MQGNFYIINIIILLKVKRYPLKIFDNKYNENRIFIIQTSKENIIKTKLSIPSKLVNCCTMKIDKAQISEEI
jgi:hypothetical protein